MSEREIAQRTDHQADRPRQTRQHVDEIAFTTSHVAFPHYPGADHSANQGTVEVFLMPLVGLTEIYRCLAAYLKFPQIVRI